MTDYRLWPATNGPNTDAGDPAAPINLGVIFQVTSTCWVKAIHFYRGATSVNGPVKGRIFVVASGTVLAGTAVDFVLAGTGWHTAALPAPVQLTANTSYKASIHSDDNYTGSAHFWDVGAGVGGITNGPLVAPDAGGTPLGIGGIQQGSFRYTSAPDDYPNSYFGGGNYWIDVTVTDTDPATHPPGTGTAPLTLAATSTGRKVSTTAQTAALAVAATGTGIARRVGTGVAGLGLAASAAGQHHGVGTGDAPLALSAGGQQSGPGSLRPADRSGPGITPAGRTGTTIQGA